MKKILLFSLVLVVIVFEKEAVGSSTYDIIYSEKYKASCDRGIINGCYEFGVLQKNNGNTEIAYKPLKKACSPEDI